MIRGILCSFTIISRLSIFLTLVSYVFLGNIFTPRQVFVTTSSFNFLYDSMLYYWSVSVTSLSECYVSMKRIEEFLLMPESKLPVAHRINYAFCPEILLGKLVIPKTPHQKVVAINENARDACVIFNNVTANWSIGSQAGVNNLSFKVQKKHLIAITGPVAAGKSSILSVILRELEIDSGELTVNGIVSYSSQEPWLFDATMRQNIRFTEPYDKERYQEVIRVCSLERDLRSLPAGDLTMVGESGICLSGGQKARINLARAIYKKSDIYLLDDPLSAVDSAVGKHIFNNCIKEFLNDKICLLVTHQEQYMKAADRVIHVCDGKIQLDDRGKATTEVEHQIPRLSDGKRAVEVRKLKTLPQFNTLSIDVDFSSPF